MKVQRLCESNLLPRDALIEILAIAVERNPCQRRNWARLVKSLGALPSSTDTNKECLHDKQAEFDEVQQWKTRQRAFEWEDQFFYTPTSATKLVKPEFVRIVTAAVEKALPSMKTNGVCSCGGGAVSMPDPIECMGWICDPGKDNAMEFDQGAVVNDSLLPENTILNALDHQNEPECDSEILGRLKHNPSCEALCMKIVVASHLIGAYHPFVCNSIWWLALKLWQSCDKFDGKENSFVNAFSWLSSYGLDSSVYLRCRLNQSIEVSELS